MTKIPANISLGGSGMLYVGYIGMLWCLKDHGFDFAEIGTTSGGSIIGGATASGIEPGEELLRLAIETLPWARKLFDVDIRNLSKFGIFSGDKIEAAIAQHVAPTFKDLKIPLHITGSNVTKKELTVFSQDTHADMPLATAIRISIGYPFIFAKKTYDGDEYVDGGLVYNKPTAVFKNDLPVISVGFSSPMMTTKRAISYIPRFFSFAGTLFDMMLDTNRPAPTAPIFHLKLHVGYSGFNFFLNEDDVKLIVERAYQQTEKWLFETEAKIKLRDLHLLR